MNFIRLALAGLMLAGAMGSSQAQTSPPLQIPIATLNAALECTTSPGLAGATKTPILLVHGTAATAEANWASNYWKVLPSQGYPVCRVSLPDKALADIQDAAEYVVQAVRTMNALSGRKVSMVGHSQGGLIAVWTMKFWPDLTPMVDDVVGLAPVFQGTALTLHCAATHWCGAAQWQLRTTSDLIAAFDRKPLPVGPSFTSILTLADEVVIPQPYGSTLDGGTNLVVQARCPGRVVGHANMAMDNVAYDATMDALTHAGTAKLSRLPLGTCLHVYMPGSDAALWAWNLSSVVVDFFVRAVAPNPVWSEPPVRAYAQ